MRKGLGRYGIWILVFLIIFVLLMLLIPCFQGGTGVFGVYTPFVVAFLIIYVILMFFVNRNMFVPRKRQN